MAKWSSTIRNYRSRSGLFIGLDLLRMVRVSCTGLRFVMMRSSLVVALNLAVKWTLSRALRDWVHFSVILVGCRKSAGVELAFVFATNHTLPFVRTPCPRIFCSPPFCRITYLFTQLRQARHSSETRQPIATMFQRLVRPTRTSLLQQFLETLPTPEVVVSLEWKRKQQQVGWFVLHSLLCIHAFAVSHSYVLLGVPFPQTNSEIL